MSEPDPRDATINALQDAMASAFEHISDLIVRVEVMRTLLYDLGVTETVFSERLQSAQKFWDERKNASFQTALSETKLAELRRLLENYKGRPQ